MEVVVGRARADLVFNASSIHLHLQRDEIYMGVVLKEKNMFAAELILLDSIKI